jgi:hypothetical protein
MKVIEDWCLYVLGDIRTGAMEFYDDAYDKGISRVCYKSYDKSLVMHGFTRAKKLTGKSGMTITDPDGRCL